MRLTLLICSSLILLTFSGCQNDPITPNGSPNISGNSFTLKKDGILYNPAKIEVSLLDDDVIGIATYAIPNNVDHNTYALNIQRSILPGTYSFSDGESDCFAIYHIQDPETIFGWETATLNVLSNDTVTKIMHCQFSATLYNDTIEVPPVITDGEFTIHYF